MAEAPAIPEFQAIPAPFLAPLSPHQGAVFKLLRLCKALLKYILANPQSTRNLSKLFAYRTQLCGLHSTVTGPEFTLTIYTRSVSQWIYRVQ